MFSLAFFLKVLHISAYPSRCLLLPFSTISHRFIITVCVGDDIDVSGLLIAIGTLDVLSWVLSVMVSLVVSIYSSYCVSNQFLNSSWNLIFFYPICTISTVDGHQLFSFPPLRPVPV